MEEQIIDTTKSICYNCENARKPASDQIMNQGYVGCAEFARKEHYDFIIEAEELAEGWVDLKSRFTLNRGSGITTNKQLLTVGVKKCKQFQNL